jgi:hypothetical protein
MALMERYRDLLHEILTTLWHQRFRVENMADYIYQAIADLRAEEMWLRDEKAVLENMAAQLNPGGVNNGRNETIAGAAGPMGNGNAGNDHQAIIQANVQGNTAAVHPPNHDQARRDDLRHTITSLLSHVRRDIQTVQFAQDRFTRARDNLVAVYGVMDDFFLDAHPLHENDDIATAWYRAWTMR